MSDQYYGLPELRKHVSSLSDPVWLRENALFIPKTSVNVLAEIPGSLFAIDSDIVVKLFGWRNTISIITSPLMRSRAKKSWDMGHWLAEHNIATPKPLAVFTRRSFGFIRNNFYITAAIQNYQTARQILKDENIEVAKKDQMIESLAKIVKKIHAGGMIHNDLTLANFLVQDVKPEAIFLVDLNRATRSYLFRRRKKFADIARMDLCHCDYSDMDSHHCFRDVFLQAYDRENFEKNRLLLQRLVRQRSLQKRVKRIRNKLLKR